MTIINFAEGLMDFTWAWKSLIKIFRAICDLKNVKFIFEKKIPSFLSWKNLNTNADPDLYWPKMLEPDQY